MHLILKRWFLIVSFILIYYSNNYGFFILCCFHAKIEIWFFIWIQNFPVVLEIVV